VLMQQLYDTGYRMAREGPQWHTRPPIMLDTDDER